MLIALAAGLVLSNIIWAVYAHRLRQRTIIKQVELIDDVGRILCRSKDKVEALRHYYELFDEVTGRCDEPIRTYEDLRIVK